MTLVMGLNRSIYPFTPERSRDLSALTPEPAPSGVYKFNHSAQITLFKKLRKMKCQLRVHPLRYQVKEFCVLFALYGLVSYSGSLTLTSSGRCKIRWLNLILEVGAPILAPQRAKFRPTVRVS